MSFEHTEQNDERTSRLPQVWRAYVPAAITLLCGLVVSGTLYQVLRSQVRHETQYAFEAEAQVHARAIERVLDSHVEAVGWMSAMIGSAPRDERRSIGQRIAVLPPDDSDTLTLLWAPRSDANGRAAFPIEIAEPGRKSHPLDGFDLMQDPAVAMYANLSREKKKTYIVSRSKAVEQAMGPGAILAIRSAWASDGNGRNEFIGYAGGAFNLDAVADFALKRMDSGDVNLDMFDMFGSPGAMALYQRRAEADDAAPPIPEINILLMSGVHYSYPVELATTRRWLIVSTPTKEYLAGAGSWLPLAGLAVSLCITILLTNHFLTQIRLRRKAEQLVLQRTAELRQTNNRLTEEIAERKRFEAERDELLTLLERSNDTLQRVNAELARSNDELQEFAVVASHDLKEPLRKISVLTDRLRTRMEIENNPDTREYLDLIQEGAERMTQRIANVLDVSRIRTHGNPFEEVRIDEAVNDVVEDLKVRLDETGGRVEVAGPLPIIEADAVQFRQLFQNLIENSLKYARTDVPPHIHISTNADGENGENGSCEIYVEDNGEGIAPDALKRIFSLYQRADGDGSHDGSGVGLAVCRKIVERHHGTIRAEADGGPGTRFVLRIPTKQNQSETTTVDDLA